MDLMQFIKPELIILIPVIYLVGIGIKKSRISDKFIPLLLGLSAAFLASLWVLSTSNISSLQDFALALFTSITQGILAAGASVYINQLYLQAKKDK